MKPNELHNHKTQQALLTAMTLIVLFFYFSDNQVLLNRNCLLLLYVVSSCSEEKTLLLQNIYQMLCWLSHILRPNLIITVIVAVAVFKEQHTVFIGEK